MRRRDYLGAAAGTGIGALAGCLGAGDAGDDGGPAGGDPADGRPPTERRADGEGVRPRDLAGANLGYTHARPDGNRVVEGAAALPGTAPLDVPLDGTPAWVAAAEQPDDPGTSVWAVALADGRVRAFAVGPGNAPERVAITPDRLPPGAPPLVAVGSEGNRLIAPPAGGAPATHPVPLGDALLFVREGGALALAGPDGVREVGATALPDARPVAADGRAYVLTAPTDRYAHGALGDRTEAAAVTVVSADGVESSFATPGEAVVEGVAPILDPEWGDPAVVVTLADAERGARVVAFDADGDRLATGPAVGQGFRWRHQLCVAPLGPDGEREAVDVLTPHVGGTVEFYRRAGGDLSVVARQAGYSSHAFGSRNLDGGLAVDADGDGRLEVLVPTDDRRRLGAVRHDDGGASVVADVPVGGRATTNLAAAPRGDRVAVGVGRTDALRVW